MMSRRLSSRLLRPDFTDSTSDKLYSQQGSGLLEFMIIFVLIVAVSVGPLQSAIRSFNGDQIQVQEVVNAYSSFNGRTFNISNLGPNGLLRPNDNHVVKSELQDLAQKLQVIVGRGGFCAAALRIVPPFTNGDVSVVRDSNETGSGCGSTTLQMREAFAQSVDPLGGEQFAVVVNNPNLFPDIAARYSAADIPSSAQ